MRWKRVERNETRVDRPVEEEEEEEEEEGRRRRERKACSRKEEKKGLGLCLELAVSVCVKSSWCALDVKEEKDG